MGLVVIFAALISLMVFVGRRPDAGGLLRRLGRAARAAALAAGRGEGRAGEAAANEIEQARSLLGVGPGADREDIDSAWKRRMRKIHPDAGGAAAEAARLNAARERLVLALKQ